MSGLVPPHILSYIGQVAVPFQVETFPPTSSFTNFPVPTIWSDTASENAYILVSKAGGTANWILLGSASGNLNTLTGNSGGAVSPSANNINLLGDGTTIDISGNPGTSTLTASVISTICDEFDADTGTATPSSGIITIAGGTGVSTSASSSTVTINAAASVPTSFVTDSGTATPSSHAIHVFGDGSTITTSGSGSTVTISSLISAGQTITGNSGGALNPTAGNWDILGSGSITTVGSGSTLTIELTGLTSHALLVGAGSTTITKVGPSSTSGQILQSQGSSADPAFSTATYPSTTTAHDILYSSATNVVGQITTANNSVLTTNGSGVPGFTALSSDGQLLIGSGSDVPAAATLTAGTGVSIVNGNNSIQISSTGSGFTWTNITGTSQSMTSGNGYQANNGSMQINFSLPSTSSFGDMIAIQGYGAGGWKISQGVGQQIHMGLLSSTSGAGGFISSANQYDSVVLFCNVANTIWTRFSSTGNIGVT